ncbi:MAG: DNA polymerase IV [Kiritimatiellales bacterium]
MIKTGQRTILHIDMDAFFAAVEVLDRPELRGKPVVVGAPPDKRGVVATCSYEARKYGIYSAMPSRTAYRLCPQAVFLPPNGKRYREMSHKVMEILARFTPEIEPVSIDEAFLDVTGARYLFGDGPAIAGKIKAAVFEETKLTCSVGVAPNMFLAKIASDLNKPDGFTMVPFSEKLIPEFLAPLPIKRMWGAGKKTQAILEQHHIRTFGDLQKAPPEKLAAWIGASAAASFRRLAFGIDDRAVVVESEEKSISNEMTFGEDERNPQAVEAALLDLADQVGARLRRANFYATTAQIKLRWSDFSTITRQRRLDPPARDDVTLRETALELLHKEGVHSAVRLIGFCVTGLQGPDETPQLELFEAEEKKSNKRREKLSAAVDEVRRKFGSKSILRGSKVEKNKPRNTPKTQN